MHHRHMPQGSNKVQTSAGTTDPERGSHRFHQAVALLGLPVSLAMHRATMCALNLERKEERRGQHTHEEASTSKNKAYLWSVCNWISVSYELYTLTQRLCNITSNLTLISILTRRLMAQVQGLMHACSMQVDLNMLSNSDL